MSGETIEPLALLREYLSDGRKVTLAENKMLQFDNFEGQAIQLSVTTPTAWKSNTKAGQFYTLGSIWVMMNNINEKKISVGMKQAQDLGVEFIKHVDQKGVVGYFSQKSGETDSIDLQRRQQTLLNKNELKFGGHQDKPAANIQKKRELKLFEKLEADQKKQSEREEKMEVNDYINERECKLINRNSILQSQTHNYLKVLHMGYEKIVFTDQKQRLEYAQKMIKQFQERELRERHDAAKNQILKDSNIDISKYRLKLAEIAMTKQVKRKTLLEDIAASGKYGSQARPIIVVPGSEYPGNISLKNCISFLRDGKFVDQKLITLKDEEKNATKQIFERRLASGERVQFEVYDSVYGFTKKEWDRVVCLFSCGEPFQLKDWPPKEGQMHKEDDETYFKATDNEKHKKIVNLFHRVKGYYMHYQDIIEPPVVKTWNVTRHIIQRNRRHMDIIVQNSIWVDLEQFLKKEKFDGAKF